MPFTENHYLQQAAELETLAAQASDPTTQKEYLALAQRFRDMANLISVSQIQSDEEAVHLAERMVGRIAGAPGASLEKPDNATE
jgi:phosphoheptose isomerase